MCNGKLAQHLMAENRQLVIVLRGVAGVGKTTLAEMFQKIFGKIGVPCLYIKWDDSFEALNKMDDIDDDAAFEVTSHLASRLMNAVTKKLANIYIIDGVFLYQRERDHLNAMFADQANMLFRQYRLIVPSLDENIRRNKSRAEIDVLPTKRISELYEADRLISSDVDDYTSIEILNSNIDDTIAIILEDLENVCANK
ncbi:hypothetical protein FACS1894122_06690 [Alphaproteobacteria bacterium]|nr:hypothetical protein FACS1894122_06690 [Alphaproteobacteria bacterium]